MLHNYLNFMQDYRDIISKPMDFSKISKKLRNGHYVIPNDIITDIRLIFSNARTYNAKGTMVRCPSDYVIITSPSYTEPLVSWCVCVGKKMLGVAVSVCGAVQCTQSPETSQCG